MHGNAEHLLARLEHHWRGHFSAQEIHRRLHAGLAELRDLLHKNTEDARLVSHTLLRLAAREEIPPEEMAAADRALHALAGTFGLALLALLPGAFLTLPVLHALARHFDIELLPTAPRHPHAHDEDPPS